MPESLDSLYNSNIMQFHTMKRRTANKKSRSVGRGGTRGKTSGRGTKGQNARAGRKKRPEIRDTIKRFPKLRGRGVAGLKPIGVQSIAINLSAISKMYAAGEKVNKETLAKKGFRSRVKILGTGDLDKKLTFSDIEISKSAEEKIKKAGGEVVATK